MVNPGYTPGLVESDRSRPGPILTVLESLWGSGTQRFPRLFRAVAIFTLAPLFLILLIGLAERAMTPASSSVVNDMTIVQSGDSVAMERTAYGYGLAWGIAGNPRAILTGNISGIGDSRTERGILLTQARRTVTATLDGQSLTAMGGPGSVETFKRFEPHLFIVPRQDVTADQTLALSLESKESQPYVPAVYVGELSSLKQAWERRSFMAISLVIVSASICALSAITAIALAFRGVDRFASISFAMFMFSWILIDLFYLGLAASWPLTLSRVFYASASFLLILTSFNYLNEYTFSWRVIRQKVVPILTVILVVKLVPIFLVKGDLYFILWTTTDLVATGCVLFMLVQMFIFLAKDSDTSTFGASIFLICVSAVILDMLYGVSPAFGHWLYPETGITLHYGPIFSAFLALTILAGFARSFLAAQTVLANNNETLSTQLAEREAEIAQVYAEREQEMREAALVGERKRIMRDMHDGVGGRLLSLSLRARGDRLQPAEMSRELEDSLQELRLIVDSMDTADGDLELALGALRGRLEPALFEAGIELDWNAGELGPQPGYGPQHVLSIYRMVQESVTNLVRHSGARHCVFESRVLDDGQIRISISDDGQGFDPNAVRSSAKGLRNLRNRAEELDGTVEFQSDNGLTVIITLPPAPKKLTHATS